MAARPSIGSLRHMAEIQHRTVTEEWLPNYPGWFTVHSARASLRPIRSELRLLAGAGEYPNVTHVVEMRWTDQVRLGDRLAISDMYYDVVSLEAVDGRQVWLRLQVKEAIDEPSIAP